MVTETYSCESCGAPLTGVSDAKYAKCEYCGSVNRIGRRENAGTSRRADFPAHAEGLLRRALLYLEDRNIIQAGLYFNRVLDINPEEYRAYLGKLMMALSVFKEEDIPACDVNLEEFDDYRKLIRFAPEKERAVYENYNQIILNRLRQQALEAQRKKEAEEIIQKNRTKKVNAFIGYLFLACIILSGIYAVANHCIQMANYNNGIKYTQAGDNANAVSAFEAAGGYKDAGGKIRLPAYRQAEALFESKKYLQAASYYAKASGYEDSAQKLRLLTKSIGPIRIIDNKLLAALRNDGTMFMHYIGSGDKDADVKTMRETKAWHDVSRLFFGTDYLSRYWIAAIKNDGSVLYSGEWAAPKELVEKWAGMIALWYDGGEIFGLKSDGTIISTDEDFRDDPLSEWRNIAKTMFYDDIRLGIRSDGTIVWDSSYYTYHYGFSHDDISAWKDIKDISIGYNGGHIVGLENDGTVVAAGDNKYGQCDVSDWTDIKAIYAKNGATLGLKNDGTVVAAGNDAYGELGVSQWTDMEEIYVGYNYTVGLRSDGIVATAGRGSPAVSGWSGVVSLITNSHGVFGLKSDGRVVYVGEKYIDEISKLQNIVYIKLHSDKLFALQGNGDLKIIGLDSDVERGEYDYLKQIKLNLSGIAVNLNS